MLRKVRNGNNESLLDLLEYLLVLVVCHKGDTQTLGTESTSTTDSVQVRVGVGRCIVVDDDVDSLDIDTSSKDVGGDEDSLLEVFEHLVSVDSAGS